MEDSIYLLHISSLETIEIIRLPAKVYTPGRCTFSTFYNKKESKIHIFGMDQMLDILMKYHCNTTVYHATMSLRDILDYKNYYSLWERDSHFVEMVLDFWERKYVKGKRFERGILPIIRGMVSE